MVPLPARALAAAGRPRRPRARLSGAPARPAGLRLRRRLRPAVAGRFGAAHGADVVDADRRARRRRPAAGTFPIHRVPADLPALRGRFHIITCLDVLEHLDDDVEGLRAIAALLAPGGQLVVTAPAYDWLWSGEDVISAHRRRYTRADAASRRAGGRLRRAVRQLLLRQRAAGRGGRGLGPAADVEPLARADEPRRAPALARRRPARGDQRGGAPRRRRAPVAARGREPRLPLAAAGAIVSDPGDRWRPWRDRLPRLRRADHRRRRARRGDRLPGVRAGSAPARASPSWNAASARTSTAPTAVAVSSCSAALHLALTVLDLPPGSEVITSSMTFCATANAIVHAGCVPVFADCDRAHVQHRRRTTCAADHAAHARDPARALRGPPVRHRRARVARARSTASPSSRTPRTRSRRPSTGGTAARSATSAASASTSRRASRPSRAGCWSARDPRLADRLRRSRCTA